MYNDLKEIGIIQAISKLTIFVNLWISIVSFTVVCTNKKFEIIKLCVQIFVSEA